MRLIDADAVRDKIEKMLNEPSYQHEGEDWQNGLIVAEMFLDDAPTVDAVPVIRCKDCALWDDADSEHLVGYCTEGDGEKITFRNEWCCWAERKE